MHSNVRNVEAIFTGKGLFNACIRMVCLHQQGLFQNKYVKGFRCYFSMISKKEVPFTNFGNPIIKSVRKYFFIVPITLHVN